MRTCKTIQDEKKSNLGLIVSSRVQIQVRHRESIEQIQFVKEEMLNLKQAFIENCSEQIYNLN